MKKIITSDLFFLLSLTAISTSALAKPQPSFSELKLGVENITYSESLGNFVTLGELSQSVSVANSVVRQVSYSGIDEHWGFYVESSATLSADITTESWAIGEFGNVQQNAFKIKANDIGGKVAYHYNANLQFTVGSKIYMSSFTRSNFEFVQPGADAFDQALIEVSLAEHAGDENADIARFLLPSQVVTDARTPQQNLHTDISPVVSVTEDQMSLLLTFGIKFDTRLQASAAESNNNFSWYIESELDLPAYTEVQSTKFNTTSLTDSFNGWGVSAKFGVRYHFTDAIALVASVDALYKERDVMKGSLDRGRLRVPNIEYSNVSYTTGIYWNY